MSRGVLANLDVEAALAGKPLPGPVSKRISAAGTLLGVYAEHGEPLWTPSPVDPRRVLPVDGLATPVLVSGEGARPPEPRLSWCTLEDPRLLSRRFGDDCARAVDARLPGTHWIDGRHTLLERLSEPPHAPDGEWVLKPALSAAGRGALRGRGGCLRDGTSVESSPAVAAMFGAGRSPAGDGALLMPWVERIADHGCRARIVRGQLAIEGFHRLLVTPAGGFRGVSVVTDGGALPPELRAADAARLEAATQAAGTRLAALGYEGPFGLDAFAYRVAGGERRFLAQCEINVRCTFGFVTAALAERLVQVRDWAPGTSVSLAFGKGAPPGEADVPLLAPGAHGEDDTSAWLEVRSSGATSGSPAAGGTRTAPG